MFLITWHHRIRLVRFLTAMRSILPPQRLGACSAVDRRGSAAARSGRRWGTASLCAFIAISHSHSGSRTTTKGSKSCLPLGEKARRCLYIALANSSIHTQSIRQPRDSIRIVNISCIFLRFKKGGRENISM